MENSQTPTLIRATKRCIILLAVGTFFASCLKDDEDRNTIALPYPQGTIPYEVIAENLQDSLKAHGFEINTGTNPPTINGRYLCSPTKEDYASDGYYNTFYDIEFNFMNQSPRGMLLYSEKQKEVVSGHSLFARIIGSGTKFTTYCYQKSSEVKEGDTMWTCQTILVISGEKRQNGIFKHQYAQIIATDSAYRPEYKDKLPKVGTFRIFHDGDSIAIAKQEQS